MLWKKVMPKLSAGRVQSVATRIVVERERQRMAFRSAEYWDVLATLAVRDASEGPRTFTATLVALDGDRDRHRQGLRPDHRPGPARRRRACTSTSDGARGPGRPAGGAAVHGHPGRGEALPAPAVRAVHHLDPPAGGGPQAAALLAADDAHRAAAVRERLHHLHADRLGEPVGDRHRRRPPADRRAVRRAATCRRSRAATPARSRTPRRRTRRSARRATTSAPRARWPTSCPPRSSSSTS